MTDGPMTAKMARYVQEICQRAGLTFDPGMSRVAAQGLINEHGKGWVSRQEVRQVACPTCGAQPDSECVEAGNRRFANHLTRVQLAKGGL